MMLSGEGSHIRSDCGQVAYLFWAAIYAWNSNFPWVKNESQICWMSNAKLHSWWLFKSLLHLQNWWRVTKWCVSWCQFVTISTGVVFLCYTAGVNVILFKTLSGVWKNCPQNKGTFFIGVHECAPTAAGMTELPLDRAWVNVEVELWIDCFLHE